MDSTRRALLHITDVRELIFIHKYLVLQIALYVTL